MTKSRRIPLIRLGAADWSRLVAGERIEVADVKFGDETRRVEIEFAQLPHDHITLEGVRKLVEAYAALRPPDPPQARELVYSRRDRDIWERDKC